MSDQNILPSAPTLYPFRLKKICDSQKDLENEISHYQNVLKKYKRAKSISYSTSAFTGFTEAMLALGALAVSLSGIGPVAGAPLAGVAGLFGLVSTIFTVGGKRFDKKISKHEKRVSLANAKHISISSLVGFKDIEGWFNL